MKKKPIIFLSYAHSDQDAVKRIYEKLMSEGYAPWMDQYGILPGENWERSIHVAINKADFILVFLSDHSINRRGFLQREIREALNIWQTMLMDDIYLIPVRLSPCTVPDELSSFQWVDMFDRTGWNKLKSAIEIGSKRRKNSP